MNTKAVRIDCLAREPDRRPRSASLPYEIQRDPTALADRLRALRRDLGDPAVEAHAITMTAELSQAFRTKREGVGFVLDAFERAFPGDSLQVYLVGGRFVKPDAARSVALEAGASNWHATARLVSRWAPNAILIDIGTTTTDIIPIAGGTPMPLGRTDPERLASGELVYTGAVRTPAESIIATLPFRDGEAGIAADGFALIGDAHLRLGRLEPADYSVATTDGRPATADFAGERLARLMCADREMLSDTEIDAIALALVHAQRGRVVEAIARVRGRHPEIREAVVTGVGERIAAEAAMAAGLTVRPLSEHLGDAARVAPAAAVAYLLAEARCGQP